MTRERIGIYLPDLSGGGAERSIISVAAGLAGRGYLVDLIVANAAGPFLGQLPPCVRFVDLKAGMPRKSVMRLAQYLRENRPAALLSALDNANVVAITARRLAGTPTRVVVSIRNQTSIDYQSTQFRRKLHLAAVRIAYRFADRIVAVSGGVADDLASLIGLPRKKIDVVYNAVVTEDLPAKAAEPVDHPWFAPGQPPVILTAGRFGLQKDHAMLMRAFVKVRNSMPARLLILGDGDLRLELNAYVKELGIEDDCQLPGYATNPFAYMSKSAVFALSSIFEGLPGVLIQAMACGCPVVSTDCPSGPDEVLQGGKYGRLVPVGDEDAMAGALIDVLRGERVPPPPESLDPFRPETVLDQIVETLLG